MVFPIDRDRLISIIKGHEEEVIKNEWDSLRANIYKKPYSENSRIYTKEKLYL